MAALLAAKKSRKGFFRRLNFNSVVKGVEKAASSVAHVAPKVQHAAERVARVLHRSENYSQSGDRAPDALDHALEDDAIGGKVRQLAPFLIIGGALLLMFMLGKKGGMRLA